MKMWRGVAAVAVAVVTGACSEADVLDYVEPRIGTDFSVAHTAGLFGKGTEELGQTLPAVLEPNGMNFWTPQTRDTEQKCVAPYYYHDDELQGFRNSHWIVGGCTQDYGSMTISVISDSLRTTPEQRATAIDRQSEISKPHYYSVYLPDEDITVELTGRSRSALFRFTYGSPHKGYIVVNPNSDEGLGSINIDVNRRLITGSNPVHRIYQGWGDEAGFAGYFAVEWPEGLTITGYGTYCGDTVYAGVKSISDRKDIGAYIEFDASAGIPLEIAAASSFTSVDAALANMQAEIGGKDFDTVKGELADIWREQLGKVEVEGGSEEDRVKFYSALYRCSFLPRVMNDVAGTYPRFGGGGVETVREGHNYYDDFSMWDTYRALHPLLLILAPDKAADMMQSLADKYEQGGWMPIFPCWNSYTAAMIGDHVASVVADAYVKGVRDFDIEKAYEGLRQNAFVSPADEADYRDGKGRRALQSYLQYGYIPLEDTVPYAFHRREQVSRTLEYAYDDFALGVLANALGHTDDAEALVRRANNYRNVIDAQVGYARGRHADGTWQQPFNPFTFSPAITEGAPCHYTWYVPHDREGLIDHLGGRDVFEAKLDSMFSEHRYWHGNEPCHQVAWMYNDVDRWDKTQAAVRHILDTEYLAEPGGLAGNDDAGQMSAWYVFGAMGFYPVCPGTDSYAVGVPLFDKVTLNLPTGKKFVLDARRSDKDATAKELKLNGVKKETPAITHSELTDGGTLEFRF